MHFLKYIKLTAVISLNSTHYAVLITEMQSAFCELGTEFLNDIYIHFNLQTVKQCNLILDTST
jgi:hypothetical protein